MAAQRPSFSRVRPTSTDRLDRESVLLRPDANIGPAEPSVASCCWAQPRLEAPNPRHRTTAGLWMHLPCAGAPAAACAGCGDHRTTGMALDGNTTDELLPRHRAKLVHQDKPRCSPTNQRSPAALQSANMIERARPHAATNCQNRPGRAVRWNAMLGGLHRFTFKVLGLCHPLVEYPHLLGGLPESRVLRYLAAQFSSTA